MSGIIKRDVGCSTRMIVSVLVEVAGMGMGRWGILYNMYIYLYI